jgi:hypothetical protein
MFIVNRIGEPEQERLGLFTEEAGEVQLEIGKILQHGIDSHHPDEPGLSNAQRLELEAGHVLAAIDLLVACGTLSREGLERSRRAKLQKLRSWLHCGTNLDAVDELLLDAEVTHVEGPSVAAAMRGLLAEAKERVEQNQKEAFEHRCDGTNIAQAKDGTFYCAHCGWNDPAEKLKAKAEEARRAMGLPELESLPDGKHRVGGPGGHIYAAGGYTSDCANGCGCWAGSSRSGGPDGIDPLGACPNAKPAEDLAQSVNELCGDRYGGLVCKKKKDHKANGDERHSNCAGFSW